MEQGQQLAVIAGGLTVSREEKLRALADSFLKQFSKHSLDAYTRDLGDFALFIGIDDIQRACEFFVAQNQGDMNYLVLEYQSNLKSRGLSVSTRNRRISAIRSFLKYCRQIGLTTSTIEISNEKKESYRDCTKAISPHYS